MWKDHNSWIFEGLDYRAYIFKLIIPFREAGRLDAGCS